MNAQFKLACLAVFTLSSAGSVSYGATLVSNISETFNSTNTVGSVPAPSNQFAYAASFTTGAQAGYTLNSITVALNDAVNIPTGFTLRIFGESGGEPDTSLLALSGNSVPTIAGNYTYTAGGFALAASSTYFVVASSGVVGGVNFFAWTNTSSTNETSSDGWTIGDGNLFENTGTGGSGAGVWTAPNTPAAMRFSVDADVIPEPSGSLLLLPGLSALCLIRRRRAAL